MRINIRLILLLRIIALIKVDLNIRLFLLTRVLTISDLEDLTKALHIVQNSIGPPPYIVKFFNEIFYPLYERGR